MNNTVLQTEIIIIGSNFLQKPEKSNEFYLISQNFLCINTLL